MTTEDPCPTPVCGKELQDSLTQIMQLVRTGENVNAQDIYGNTPMMYCVMGNNPGAIALLLEEEADPTIKNNYNETPLEAAHRLAQHGFDRSECIRILELVV